jgi:hypothetical protein
MLTFPLGKAPSTFPSLGGDSTQFVDLAGISAGTQDDEVIGGSDGFYPNTGDFLDSAFIAFWAKPSESSSSNNRVWCFDSANPSTSFGALPEFFAELGKTGLVMKHVTNNRTAGVTTTYTNINISYSANLGDWHHYMFFYLAPGNQFARNHYASVYVDGVEVGSGSYITGGDKQSPDIRTIGGREFTFYSGTAGGSNFYFDKGFAGRIGGYYEDLNGFYNSLNVPSTLSSLIDRHYGDYYDSSTTYIGPTPDTIPQGAYLSGFGTGVDYTGVSMPSYTRPTTTL